MEYFKTYSILPEDAIWIRKLVFMEEQGFVNEFDDADAFAKHIVLYSDENQPVATCRYFYSEEEERYLVGRIAVRKEFRQKHYGKLVLCEAQNQLKNIGAKELYLAAQVQAVGFYEKMGFSVVGEPFLEEHCPHVWMCRKLKEGEPKS